MRKNTLETPKKKPLGYPNYLLLTIVIRMCTYTYEGPNKRPYSRDERNDNGNSILSNAKNREDCKHKYTDGGQCNET